MSRPARCRTTTRARCATSTRSITTACSSSPPTASRCSTSCSPTSIPDKGRVLTALSTFWFEQTAHLGANHLVSSDPTDFPETAGPEVAGRAMLVRAREPVRLECIARGYLVRLRVVRLRGRRARCRGRALPAGLRQAERLPEPIFTPTTKADVGHDVPAHRRRGRRAGRRRPLRAAPRHHPAVYGFGAAHAAERGLILADTKLEFG